MDPASDEQAAGDARVLAGDVMQRADHPAVPTRLPSHAITVGTTLVQWGFHLFRVMPGHPEPRNGGDGMAADRGCWRTKSVWRLKMTSRTQIFFDDMARLWHVSWLDDVDENCHRALLGVPGR